MPSAATSERRVALLLGNAGYKEAPLSNPVNDAQDVARALKELGFSVILQTNSSQKQMKQAIREFGTEIKNGAVAVFYYAGHGVQSKGRNYLIPIGATINSEAELEDEAVDLGFVLNFMENAQNRVNIVILDACRNNPFSTGTRSASRGLAQMDAAKGTLIAFATSPGATALDGTGRNGVYTKYLLDSLRQPGAEVESVFKRVRKAVYQETAGKQIPWESSSLIGDFMFNNAASAETPRPSTESRPTAPAIDPAAFELAFWNEISNRRSPDDYRAYLEQYPNGRFARLARTRIEEFREETAAPASAAAKRVLGTWNGQYGYDTGNAPRVPFKLVISSVEGMNFAGRISEPATFGNGTSRFLFATVRGTVEGSRVQFIKTYDGTGGQNHSVRYQGNLNPEGRSVRLNGNWAIERSGRILRTGFFESSQN